MPALIYAGFVWAGRSNNPDFFIFNFKACWSQSSLNSVDAVFRSRIFIFFSISRNQKARTTLPAKGKSKIKTRCNHKKNNEDVKNSDFLKRQALGHKKNITDFEGFVRTCAGLRLLESSK